MIGRSVPPRGSTRPVVPGPIDRAAPARSRPRRPLRPAAGSLRRQLGVGYVLVTSVAVLLLEVVALIAVAQGVLVTRRLVHRFVAEDLAPVAASLLAADAPPDALRAYLERPLSVRDDVAPTALTLPQDPRGYTVVTDASGVPWFDNRSDARKARTPDLPRSDVTLVRRATALDRTMTLIRPARTATATPLEDPSGRRVGTLLQVSSLWPAAPGLLALAGVSLALGGLAVVGIGTAFGLMASRPLTRRIAALGEAADAWARGELDRTVDDPSHDELGRLGRQLNGMATDLRAHLDARAELARARERARLARDLHDTVKQELFGASLLLGAAQAGGPNAARSIDAAVASIDRAKRDLGELIDELRPLAAATARPLRERLHALADEHPEGVLPDLRLVLDPVPEPTAEVAEALERIAREALSNAVRHAGASKVDLRVRSPGAAIRLDVVDDGHGFVPDEAEGRGLGLASMQERARRAGGHLEISSRPGRGTRVRVTVPLRPGAAQEAAT